MKAQAFTVEEARIGFKNFAGEVGPYNKDGKKDFALMIDNDELLNDLVEQGYNVKYPKPNPEINPEEDTRSPYLMIKVDRQVSPLVIKVDVNGAELSRQRVPNEETGMLDWLSPKTIDLVVRPYDYSDSGFTNGTGISAWLNEIVYVVEVSPLEAKYAR